MHMKFSGSIARFGCAAVFVAACCAGLTACAGDSGATTTDPSLNTTDVSGGVAATVNGTDIGENAITAYITEFRSAQDLDNEDAWGEWLVDNGYTVDAIRGDTLDYYVSQELVRQAAEENDVSVDEEQVDEQVQKARDTVDSDDEWNEALSERGLNEETYRANVRMALLQNDLMEAVASDAAASDDEVLSSVQTYAKEYNGAKRSSHILFSSDDEATAQEVLDKINAGELDFAQAAREYSTDTASAEDGGDIGWDKTMSLVDDYQTVLDGLGVGQVSGLVTSQYGIHIIKCTDQLEAPDEVTSLDQVSSGFVDYIRQSLDASEKQKAFSEYMTNYQDEADIVKNPLPDGLPYDIDLAPYEQGDDDASGDDASNDNASDGTALDDTSGDVAAEAQE